MSGRSTFSPIAHTEAFDVVLVGGKLQRECVRLWPTPGVALGQHWRSIRDFQEAMLRLAFPWLGFHNRERQPVVRGLIYRIVERRRAAGGARGIFLSI